MTRESKKCQNCHQEFWIESDDFTFYEKINVPPPTWCPDCRAMRRMSFRNEITLYRRKCDAPGHDEMIVAMYHQDSPFKVFDSKYWWSDNWDALDYGRDYDFSRSFFEQMRELSLVVPRINIMNKNSVNSEYCNNVSNHKNCYLEIAGYDSENVMYSNTSLASKDCIGLFFVNKSELCYELQDSSYCYRVFFSRYCEDCTESSFLYDCKGCSYCFGCVGLRNKHYYIFNKPYSKEEYEIKIQQYNIGSFPTIKKLISEFDAFKLAYPVKFARLVHSENVTGDNIENSKNCQNCFGVGSNRTFGEGVGAQNSKNLIIAGWNTRDTYDCIQMGGNISLSYELISGAIGNYLTKFSHVTWTNSNLCYTDNCHNCSNCFGCAGLRNKQYCILNKQYSKGEYEGLVPRIIKQMDEKPYVDKRGRVYKYGEFFPSELSPFAYNETITQEYFPLVKNEALAQGYDWREPEAKQYQITISHDQLPDDIKDVKDSILKGVISCAHGGKCKEQCTTAFKIIEPELQFYRKMNLPLSRLCPNCRHYQSFNQRNSIKLWPRKCQCAGVKSENGIYQNVAKHQHGTNRCPNEFQTTYAPERSEIVYCEQCYNAEIS